MNDVTLSRTPEFEKDIRQVLDKYRIDSISFVIGNSDGINGSGSVFGSDFNNTIKQGVDILEMKHRLGGVIGEMENATNELRDQFDKM